MPKTYLSGIVGLDFDDSTIARVLDSAAGKPVEIELNSPGGDAFAGLAAANLIRAYRGTVSCRILALAGSAASIIAASAHHVTMAPGASIFIHEPRMLAGGTADELDNGAGVLRNLSAAFADIYVKKSNRPMTQIQAAMKAETFYFDDEAVVFGLADVAEGTAIRADRATAQTAARSRVVDAEARFRASGRKPTPGQIAAALGSPAASRASSPAPAAIPGAGDLSAQARASCASERQYRIFRRYLSDEEILVAGE